LCSVSLCEAEPGIGLDVAKNRIGGID